MKKINLRKLGKFIPIIGIILFIYILMDIGIEKVANAFTLIPFYYYVIAFLPFFPRLYLAAYKWQIICKKQKMDFRLGYLMKVFLVSSFYGNVTPAGLGWYIKIFYIRKKSNASIEKCIANFLLESNLGFVSSLSIALIGSIILINVFPGFFPVILAFLLFNVVALVFLMKKSHGGRVIRFFIRPLIPEKYRERLDKSVDSLYEDMPRIRDMAIPFVVDLIISLIISTQVYIIALAFDINISYPMFVLIHMISAVMMGILPISVGGLGVREGTFVYLMSYYGVAAPIAFVISLSGFFVKMLIPSLFGAVLSFRKEVSIE